MARGISDTLKAAIPDSITALGIRIGTVDNDVVLINSSNRDILFGGKNYAARSNLMEVGDFSESLELKSHNVSITFGLANNAVARQFQTQGAVGWDVEIIQFWLHNDGPVVGSTILWQGSVTGYKVEHDGDDSSIAIEASTRFQNYRTSAGRKTNDASQQKAFPGDRGMEFAHRVGREFRWGSDNAGGETLNPSNAARR